MAPTKVKPEDFLDALLDSRVVNAIAQALAPLITTSIETAIDRKLGELISSVRTLENKYATLKSVTDDLKQENTQLNQQLTAQLVRIDDLESYSRIDNLIIKGLPEQGFSERATPAFTDSCSVRSSESHESVESTFIKFCQDTLNVTVSRSDISSAHRMRPGQKDTVRPIIVRFANRRTRDKIYRARKMLKRDRPTASDQTQPIQRTSQPVYISEHLTKAASDLFFEARQLVREKRFFSTWTQNGQVHVRISSDASTKPKVVKCHEDIKLCLR